MAPPMTIPYDYIWKQVSEVIKSRPHINWALVQSMQEDVRYILTLGPVGENMRLFIVEPIDSLPGLVEISLTLSPEEFKITQEYFAAHPDFEHQPPFKKVAGGLYIAPTNPYDTGSDNWKKGGYVYYAAKFPRPFADGLFSRMAIYLIDCFESILLLREKIADWQETRN
jgi:hypothetical protein